MTLSLFRIRKRLAAPLAWLMVLAMLSPLSPHLAEGVALCIGDGHMDVEATGPAHHGGDGRTAPLASAEAEGPDAEERNASGVASQSASLSPARTPGALFAGAPETSSPGECSDIPLRLVQPGDACYQAVQNGGGPDVPPLLTSQAAGFARANETAPSDPNDSDTRGPRHLRAASSSPPSGNTVVLLI